MHNPFNERWFRIGVLVCFSLPILVHIFNLQFTRLTVDDYDYARVLESEGLFGSVGYWYEVWTGNYTSSFVQGLFMSAGVDGIRWLLVSIPILWWGLLIWFAYEVVLLFRLQYPRYLAVFLGTFVLFATIDGMPNVFDSLYWAAGAIAHVMPLVGFIFTLCVLLWTHRKQITGLPFALIVLGLGAFSLANAGFSTVATAFQIVAVLMLMGAYGLFSRGIPRRNTLMMLAVILVTCFVAMIIIGAAPGSEIRQSQFPPPPDLPNFIRLTLLNTVAFFCAAVIFLGPFSLLLGILFGGLVGYYLQPNISAGIRNHNLSLIGLVLLLGLILMGACYSTGAYAMSSNLPARANTIPAFTMTLVALVWGYLMGVNLRDGEPNKPRRIVFIVLALLLLAAPGWMLANGLQLLPRIATYAHEWDQMDEQLKLARDNGVEIVELSGYSSFDLGDKIVSNPLTDNPTDTSNRVLALYYGVEQVIGPPVENDDTD